MAAALGLSFPRTLHCQSTLPCPLTPFFLPPPTSHTLSLRHFNRLLRETFEPQQLTHSSIFDGSEASQAVIEVGPRTNFSTAFSTNATSICTSVGLNKVGHGVEPRGLGVGSFGLAYIYGGLEAWGLWLSRKDEGPGAWAVVGPGWGWEQAHEAGWGFMAHEVAMWTGFSGGGQLLSVF